MKYIILSIDDSREQYKKVIRERVELEEVEFEAVNGTTCDIRIELQDRAVQFTAEYPLSRGELGVWCSNYDAWNLCVQMQEPLIVFEDDAIPTEEFMPLLHDYLVELPKDFDFLSLWVPENQHFDYLYDVVYDEKGNWQHIGPLKNVATSNYNFGAVRLAKAYNGYGNVAQLYSPKGAGRLIALIHHYGINCPVDCFVYNQAHCGRLNGYAPKPHWAKAVTYDWPDTVIHNTEMM